MKTEQVFGGIDILAPASQSDAVRQIFWNGGKGLIYTQGFSGGTGVQITVDYYVKIEKPDGSVVFGNATTLTTITADGIVEFDELPGRIDFALLVPTGENFQLSDGVYLQQ